MVIDTQPLATKLSVYYDPTCRKIEEASWAKEITSMTMVKLMQWSPAEGKGKTRAQTFH
jgi:predicted secreted Zn-dependent protease